MAENIQSLLTKIHEENIQKTQEEAAQIIAKAQEEAAQILAKAQEEATHQLATAKKEADLWTSKGEESLKQAARDILLSLRCELEKCIEKVSLEVVNVEMNNKESLGNIIAFVISEFIKNNGNESRIEVLLPADKIAAIDSLLKTTLKNELVKNATISPSSTIKGGFKIILDKSGMIYDFTDQSLAEALSEYLNPKLAALLS